LASTETIEESSPLRNKLDCRIGIVFVTMLKGLSHKNMELSRSPESLASSAPRRRKKRRLSNGSSSKDFSIHVMSPSMYLSIALKNKGIDSRIGPLSLEQALYFEPYREAQISTEILKAVRQNDLPALRAFEVDELSQRNQFGENLMHLVCRLGLDLVEYLVSVAKLPLNVRDKYGRTPLHNACLAAKPNFGNVVLLLKHAPKLVVFEDDKGNTPFEYIPARNYGNWSRFLSEERILKVLQSQLVEEEGKNVETIPRIPCQKLALP
jgi:ankyrin repeat protein